MNPLGMVEALIGAMNHAANLEGNSPAILEYTAQLRGIMHSLMVEGKGTRDLCGPSGLTTEGFIDAVAEKLSVKVAAAKPATPVVLVAPKDFDEEAMKELFASLDTDGNGMIDYEELVKGFRKLGVHPRK